MIKYVNINNIDDRIITKSINLLEEGRVIAFPTDSNWSIACSVKSRDGINQLKKIKGNTNNFTFTIICSSISQISSIAVLNDKNFKIIKKYCPGPYVFILPALKHVEKIINMKRIQIGVRIPQNSIPLKIINFLQAPLFSITASKQMMDTSWWDHGFAEENLFEFGWELEDILGLDYIIDVDSGEPQPKVLSTVIDLTDDEPHVIRQGAGRFIET